MGFQQGLSGLNVTSQALNVISNNIANSGTVGFKAADTQFADVYAASLTGVGSSNQVGSGASVAAVSQLFTQGNTTSTGNPLNVAINGQGFFQISNNGSTAYTRNGQFQVSQTGFLQTSDGYAVQGYPAVYNAASPNGVIVPSTPGNIQINNSNIAPNATTAVVEGINLNSTLTPPTAAHPFSIGDPLSYNYSTGVTTYDSLGNPHSVRMYFVQVAPTGTPPALPGTNPAPPTGTTAANTPASQWDMYMSVDGTATSNVSITTVSNGVTTTAPSYSMYFNSSGGVISPTTLPSVAVDLAGVAAAQTPAATNLANTPLNFTWDMSKSTQFGIANSNTTSTQDGYSSGSLTGVSISSDGVVQGTYSNQQSRLMGQLVLASFVNPNGLQSLGGNQYAATAESGQPLVGQPGTGVNGVLATSSVESSNVDLTTELVDMITQQRAYQANAQSIKTQDAILQTLVNLQ